MGRSPSELFDRYHRTVFRYLCRLGSRRDVAEDLTQDVFVRAIQALGSYRDEERELPWLMRIARNRWIDHIRSASTRGQSVEVDETGSAPPQQLINLGLREALGTLDALDRDVFLLREVAGLGYIEIAEVCSLTPDAVRSRIHRARCALRLQLLCPMGRSPV
jgi:RNA polymerase sigma-70 factor (ECF subfamily)